MLKDISINDFGIQKQDIGKRNGNLFYNSTHKKHDYEINDFYNKKF